MIRTPLRRGALWGSLTVTALALSALPARANEERLVVQPELVAPYLNGGIGIDSEQHMRQVAKDWPLRMSFSENKDNEFVAGVRLLVTDAKGRPVLDLADAGPLTYARLSPGRYRVTATFHGKTETRQVKLDGATRQDLHFHWKAA